ncbi:cation transporter [Phenylobacterium koreense]|uniref:Co/Zn/Cd efflux system component n=1 Tax=Phenylobacterium koreense TaxID=266125 RepID=A0ABV2EKD5_9CAUL
MHDQSDLQRTVRLVAILNFAYFGVELAAALSIHSVSLLADSADFFEDAAVNFLIFAALGWSARKRAKVGMLLAGVLLVPAIAFVLTLVHKLQTPTPPVPEILTLTGLGAMCVNLYCAFRLARFRHHGGSLTKAAFLSARNDVLANVAIVGAGLATLATHSIWPDIVVGAGIALMNLDAAKEVLEAARDEHRQAEEAQP